MSEIYLYDVIGWNPDETKSIVQDIRNSTGDIDVRINSEGGVIFDGMSIYSALAEYDRGKVNVHIDAIAASIASVIAMAGDTITMSSGSWMMIHKPMSMMMFANADSMRKEADILDKLESGIVNTYVEKTGISAEKIAEMLRNETWLDADEAVALKFATEKKGKSKQNRKINFESFKNPPASVLEDYGLNAEGLKVARLVEQSLRDAGVSVSAAKRAATRAASFTPEPFLRDADNDKKRDWSGILQAINDCNKLLEV